MKKKKVFRFHPILGKREFNEDHAKNLDELEKTNPSGWVEYDGQEILELDESDSSKSKSGKDATNGTGNKGNIVKDSASKSGKSGKGKSSSK